MTARLPSNHPPASLGTSPLGTNQGVEDTSVQRRFSGNALVFAGHLLLSAFLALGHYPATQDGPAHLYTVHVLRALARDPSSPYHHYFAPNLHFGANGLYFYFGVWAGDYVPLEWVTRIIFFAALLLLPLSALAFSRALRLVLPANATPTNAAILPSTSAWALACPLAYSYFLYRGLFNYSLGIPFAFFALASVVAQGGPLRGSTRIALAGAALLSTALAAFAHASAIAFLIFAVPIACLPMRGSTGTKAQRVVGALVMLLLLASTQVSRVGSDGPAHLTWWTPWKSAAMLVRAFGITQSLVDVVPAALILGVLLTAAFSRAAKLRLLRTRYAELWPLALGLVVLGGYFVVPNVAHDISGVNERLPLFAGMLLMPYVTATGKLARSLAYAAAPWGAYMAFCSARHYVNVEELREAADAVPLERGATLYPVALDLKLGMLSVDLGRYLGADIARRHDAVTGNLFIGNPVFPVWGKKDTPHMADPGAVEAFSHMSEEARSAALADPKSPIRRFFDDTVTYARRSRYVAVIPYGPLDSAFQKHVLSRLVVRLMNTSSSKLPIYENLEVAKSAQ